MLNLIPFTGPRRKMANMNPKSQISCQILQGDFPQPTTAAVAAAPVGCDHQFMRLGITLAAHLGPPSPNRFRCEARSVVIDPNTNPTLVLCDIIDTVGDGLPELFIHKVVNTYFHGLAFRLPFSSAVFEVADQFFLFGIDRNNRLTALLDSTHSRVDMLKLRIPIRMSRPFSCLAIALQAVAGRYQQATHGIFADFAFSSGEFQGQSRGALTG